MADNVLKSRIKHAYKTESEWTTLNPVLLKGEVAYSSDKGNMYKVGDGTSKWSALSYNKSDTANTATKLATARTIQTNLASDSTASFDGSANVTPGVTGVLPVANGGTGNSSVDTTPTDGSTKMVTSGGVYTALSEKQDTIPAWGGASEGSIILNGLFNTVAADYSTAEGYYTNAFGAYSHAEGYYTTALGENSHAEGYSANAVYNQIQDLSTSTSNDDIITAWNSNKSNRFSLAKGNSSHVEGRDCLALVNYSHAEGLCTIVRGANSHAEGSYTIASGYTSHAEGYHTTASGDDSHVQGRYNIEDASSTYAHIVGNGTANARSNAYTLDWDGNGWYAGGLTVTSDLSVKSTIKPNVISWYTPSNEKYDEIQLRLSGNTGVQGISFVAYKNGSTAGFYNIISSDGSTSLPGNIYAKLLNGTSSCPLIGTTATAANQVAYINSYASNITINAKWGGSSFSSRNLTVSSSDIRLKENISNTEVTDALSVINKISMHSFDWKDTNVHQSIGFIADELEEIDPHLAIGGGYNDDGSMNVKSVDTFYLLGYLTKGIQELSKENNNLREEIQNLKSLMAS